MNSFDRFLTDPSETPAGKILPMDYHLGGKGADDFWTFFGAASYQGHEREDSDPDLSYDVDRNSTVDPIERRTGELALTGQSDAIGPSKADHSNVFAVFAETIRDRSLQRMDYEGEDRARLARYTVVHEIGQLFGLEHQDASIGPDSGPSLRSES